MSDRHEEFSNARVSISNARHSPVVSLEIGVLRTPISLSVPLTSPWGVLVNGTKEYSVDWHPCLSINTVAPLKGATLKKTWEYTSPLEKTVLTLKLACPTFVFPQIRDGFRGDSSIWRILFVEMLWNTSCRKGGVEIIYFWLTQRDQESPLNTDKWVGEKKSTFLFNNCRQSKQGCVTTCLARHKDTRNWYQKTQKNS